MRYKIKAHYGNNSVICGYVNAASAKDAIRSAEDQGLFDQRDPDWDDISAIVSPAPEPLGSYRDQMKDAGRGHLVGDND